MLMKVEVHTNFASLQYTLKCAVDTQYPITNNFRHQTKHCIWKEQICAVVTFAWPFLSVHFIFLLNVTAANQNPIKKIRLIDFQKCVRKKKSVVHALYLRITTNNNFDDPCCRVPNDSNSHTYIQLNQAPNAAMHNHTKIKLKKKCTERPIKLQYLYIYWWPQAMETRNHHPSPMEPSTIAIIDDYYLSFTTQSSFYFETRRNNLINQSKIDFPQFILASIQLHGQYREMNDFPWKRQRHG